MQYQDLKDHHRQEGDQQNPNFRTGLTDPWRAASLDAGPA